MKLTRPSSSNWSTTSCRGRWTDQEGARGRRARSFEIDEVVLVGGSTRIPKVQAIVKELFGREPHKGVIRTRWWRSAPRCRLACSPATSRISCCSTSTPLSLGIETLGGVMTTLIQRNTTIPTRKSETFSTAADNQTSVEVHVLQGERPWPATTARSAGSISSGAARAARHSAGRSHLRLDANGIVNVSAKDLGRARNRNHHHRVEWARQRRKSSG